METALPADVQSQAQPVLTARGKKRPVAHDENGDLGGGGPKKHAKMPTLSPHRRCKRTDPQRSFARIIECPEGGFAYTHGEEHDEVASYPSPRMGEAGRVGARALAAAYRGAVRRRCNVV